MKILRTWNFVALVLPILCVSFSQGAGKKARALVDSWADDQYDEASED